MSRKVGDSRVFQGALVVATLLGIGMFILVRSSGDDQTIVLSAFLGLVLGISTVAASRHSSTAQLRGWRGYTILGAWVLPMLLMSWTRHYLEAVLFAGFGVINLALAEGLAGSLNHEAGSAVESDQVRSDSNSI
jgi:hypothetical protein